VRHYNSTNHVAPGDDPPSRPVRSRLEISMSASRQPFLSLLPAACFACLMLWLPSLAQDKAQTPEVVTRLKGHDDAVYSVAYSPDGKYLVTGSLDHTLKLWDVAAGKEIKTYGGKTGHQKMVLAVTFSPDGQMIASGSADNTLKVWDVPVSSPIRSLPTGAAATAVALSADGTKLAAGCKDGSVRLLNAADFKELYKLAGHQGAVTGVAFSANGQILASASADRTVRFWNVANGQLVAAVGAHAGAVNGVTIHPNNTAAYSVGDDGMLKFWQIPPAAAKVLPGHTAAIHALAMSLDGSLLVSGGEDKTVRQFAVAGAKEIRALSGPQGPIASVALNAPNTLIAAGSSDRHVYLWNAADGKPAGQILSHDGAVTGVQFHPQGTQLATAGADGLVKLWAVPAAPSRTIAHPDSVLAAVASPDSKKLYTGSADRIVRVWDATKPAMERQFTGHTAPVTALAVSANGQILASGGADATIRLWNQAMGKEADTIIAHGGPITSLALSPAGNQLLSTGEDGLVKLWQLPTVPPKTFIHPDQVTALALTADGARVLTGAGDKTVRLWNLATGAKEREYTNGPTLPISALALGGNGATIAAGSLDKSVTLWNVADGKVVQKITLPAPAQAIAFTPDSQQVALGLADGAIKLLKVADAKETRSLTGHKGAITGLAFSAKGDVLYSASADKTVQSWALPDGTPKTKFDHDAAIADLALSKDGTLLAAAGDKAVKVWNLADGKVIAAWTAPAESRGIAISPDKARLVLAGADKLARIYEIDGRLVESFAHDGPVQAATFIDGKRVVTVAADKTARLWTSSLVWQKPHAGPARRAVFTPKGDQVLSGGDDKAIRIWNAADGKQIKALANPEGTITQLGISADGARIASAGSDKSAKVWTLADGKVVATIAVGGPVQCLALSPNGQRIAVSLAGGKDASIRIYDVALGRELEQLADHAGSVTSLAFQGDNRTLITGALDKTARILDVPVLTALPAHAAGKTYLQFHNTGTQLLTGGADKIVKLWDLAKQAPLKTFGPLADAIRAVAYSKDYTQIAAAAGNVVKVWNIADGKELTTLTHPAPVLSLSFSQDKTRIATGAADKQTRLWEVATGRELQFFAQADPVEAALVAPSGVIASAAGKQIQLETPSIVRVIAADASPVYALAMLPANTHVLTAGADKSVKMWNLATGANDRTFAGATAPLKAVAVAKNGLLLAAAGADRMVRIYQVADAKEIGAVTTGGEVRTLGFTPNNLALLAGVGDKTLRAWATPFAPGQPSPPEFMQPVQSYNAAEPIQELALAADNATVYSAGLDSAIHVWKLASPTPTRNFPHPNNVDSVAFQPKGALLASGGHDGKVRLFDLVKNAQVKEITAHVDKNVQNTIYTVAFSADGQQLVTSSLDNSLKLWDVAGGKLIREFKAHKVKEFEKGHADPVYTAAISPDGKWLASGSGGIERVIKIWNIADGSVVRDLANPQLKVPPMQPASSHPGDVLHLHFTRDGKLISLGDAPKNRGYLAVWDPQAGKLLFGETLSMGTFFGMAVSPDERTLAVATGSRGKMNPELNNVYLLKVPPLGK
jgi:WD40 repeat protein